jgi:hypothetical protein
MRVQLHPIEIGIEGREIGPNAQGNFDFSGIIPGSYIISASFGREGKAYGAWRRIEVGNSDVNDAALAPSMAVELGGRVKVDGDKEIDLSKLSVNLQPSPFSPTVLMAPPSARVSAEGNFLIYASHDVYQVEISGLPDDFYPKSVRWGDRDSANRTIDLSISEAVSGEVAVIVSPNGGRIEGVVKNEKDELTSGALVVLVPDSSHRQERFLFKEVTTDENGRFTIRGIPPGEYKLFAWEDIEPGACEDPEFMKPYENKGEKVTIEVSGSEARDLRVIPANASQ